MILQKVKTGNAFVIRKTSSSFIAPSDMSKYFQEILLDYQNTAKLQRM